MTEQGQEDGSVRCFKLSRSKLETTSSESSRCLFGQSLNDLFQGLDERQPSIAELVTQIHCNLSSSSSHFKDIHHKTS